MSTTLPPVPHQVPTGGGNSPLPPVWSDWFKQLLARVGGNVASSNAELKADLTAQAPYLVPTGGMIDYGGATAPTGWLLCDGSSYLRTDYPALFAAIGTTFGAVDGTHFSVPPSGVFMVSKHAGTFATLGATGGAETAALPDHAHSVSLASSTPSANANNGASGGGTNVPTATHTHAVTGNTGNPTTSPSIATLPPYVVVQRIIKT